MGGEGQSGGGVGREGGEAQRVSGAGGDDGQDLKAGGIKVAYITQYRDIEQCPYSLCYGFGTPPTNNKHAVGPRRPVKKKRGRINTIILSNH